MKTIDLCAGYGGLTMGLGLEPAWYSEIEPNACRVYEANHPGVEPLGAVEGFADWPRADAVVAGFPCQPASQAGRRKGMNDDRWIWPTIAKCLGVVQPELVVLENVRGLLTVNGQAAIQEVFRDLAALGFDAGWGLVRASDAGACHRRERWFCIARHTDSLRYDRSADEPRQNRRQESPRADRGPCLPTPTARDVKDSAFSPAAFGDRLPGWVRDKFLPTPTATVQQERNATSGRQEGSQHHNGWTLNDIAYADLWGEYLPAIAMHEQMLGRPVPDPTIPNARSRTGRALNPVFVEWMMGIPEGWVTDVDISRTAQLKLLGNGVVPQQAALAARTITEMVWGC